MGLLPAGGLRAKHYILAALMATILTAAVITIVFVVLSPARISLSVVRADHRVLSQGRLQLSIAVAAANPSRRAAVKYQSVYVDVSNGTRSTNFLRANVTTPLPLRQPRRNVTTVDASLSLVGGPWTEAFTGNMTSGLVVTVTALARFKVGVAWTRLYDIKVSCGPIDFFPAPADRRQSRSYGSAAGLPIDCQTA